MARRKLIGGSGCVRLVAQDGSGWVNCTPGRDDANPYPLAHRGTMRVTVSATGCGGVRLYDWDNGTAQAEHTSAGGLHTLTGIVTGRRGPVVRVLNPTENTEVLVNYEVLNPPPLHRAIFALVGVVLNGTQKSYRPGAVPGHQACEHGGLHTRRDSGRSWTKGHSQRFLAPRRCAPADYRLRRGQVDVDLPRVANPVRNEWAAQGANCPRHHGQAGDGEAVRFHGGPVEADIAGCDDLPGSRLTALVAGGWRKWLAGNSPQRKPSTGTSSQPHGPAMSSLSRCKAWRRIGGGKSPQHGGRRRRCGLRLWHPPTPIWGRACASTRPGSQTSWGPPTVRGGVSPTYAPSWGGGVDATQTHRRHADGHAGGGAWHDAARAVWQDRAAVHRATHDGDDGLDGDNPGQRNTGWSAPQGEVLQHFDHKLGWGENLDDYRAPCERISRGRPHPGGHLLRHGNLGHLATVGGGHCGA